MEAIQAFVSGRDAFVSLPIQAFVSGRDAFVSLPTLGYGKWNGTAARQLCTFHFTSEH